ncbi:hypothetical protein [Burkholderia sp. GbtcB21]|nr:hypothetical protein [Burkholderia sp. GbtcB21]
MRRGVGGEEEGGRRMCGERREDEGCESEEGKEWRECGEAGKEKIK